MYKKKKLLLLTLGTGPLSDTREAGYKSVQYTIEGVEYRRSKEDSEGTATNFVAEPIIDYCEPDDIFILGTVKSVWHQFYASAITENNADLSYMDDTGYLRLLQIERNNNIYTSGEELEELSREISKIFAGIKTWKKYSEKYTEVQPAIHIFLTRYGINAEELKDNYDILKQIENFLDQDYEYEITFDITHSFRSLPIYNLVILNYIKNITKYHISISHIYYGNIEARYELDGKAPIVDLYDLAHILDLTNGVAEFKDTGSSVSLLQLIDEEDPLKEVLEKFDFAMQLNAFDKIKCELRNLCKLIQGASDDSRYTGVREMIRTVLDEKFFESGKNGIAEMKHISDVDLKFSLTKWFFKQNRKGLGLATGLEALRDITTPAFMKARGFSGKDERKYRESAETFFVYIAQMLDEKPAENRSSMEEAVCNLGLQLKHYKDIRNIFAHSLSKLTDSNIDIEMVRKDIDEFEERLYSLKKEYDSNQRNFEALFKRQYVSSRVTAKSNVCRVIIDFIGNCNYNRYKKSNSGTIFDVFYLDKEVWKQIAKGAAGATYKTTEKAYYLFKYLKKYMPIGYDKVVIVLYECPKAEAEMIFRAFMENLEGTGFEVKVEHTENRSICPCKKIGLSIMVENHEEQFQDSEVEYALIMGMPLKQLP